MIAYSSAAALPDSPAVVVLSADDLLDMPADQAGESVVTGMHAVAQQVLRDVRGWLDGDRHEQARLVVVTSGAVLGAGEAALRTAPIWDWSGRPRPSILAGSSWPTPTARRSPAEPWRLPSLVTSRRSASVRARYWSPGLGQSTRPRYPGPRSPGRRGAGCRIRQAASSSRAAPAALARSWPGTSWRPTASST